MGRKILFEIEVENTGAARRIESLREEIRRLNKEIKGAEVGSPVYNDLIAKLTDAKQETARLKDEQKALNREFQAARFPKDSLAGLRIEYSKLTEQIKVLSAAERGRPFGQSLIQNAAKVKSEIDGIEQSLGRFTGNVGNYRSAFGSLADIATGGLIGGGLVVTVNALTQAFVNGVDEVAQYGAALDRLSAITGVTGEDLEELRQRAEGLTTLQIGDNQIVNTAKDIFEAFTLVGSARPELLQDAAALEEVTKQALILSQASGDTLETSVAALTTTLGQFQEESSASTRIINELAAGSKAGASEIADTTTALQKFGTTAANSNISTAESIALVETLADRQVKGEQAGTALRNVLAKLAGAEVLPPNALKQLEAAGVDINVLSDATLPLSARLTELGKLQGNTAALTKIFGLENLSVAQILTDGVPKYEQLLAAISGTNEAYVQAEINSGNLQVRLDNLQAKVTNLAVQGFNAAEPAISGVVEILTDLIDILAEAPEIIEENENLIISLAAAMVFLKREQIGAAIAAAANSQAWQVLTNATARAEAATKLLGLAQRALPFVAIAAAVYGLVTAIDALTDSEDDATESAVSLADAQAMVNEEASREIAISNQAFDVLKSDTAGKVEKKKAIDSLLQQFPQYLKGLDLEKASVEDLTRIQDLLNKSIIQGVLERKKAAAVQGIQEERANITLRIQQLSEGAAPTLAESDLIKTSDVGLGNVFNTQAKNQAIISKLREQDEKLAQKAVNTAETFNRAIGVRVNAEDNLSAAEQDALDRQRQFADRNAGLSRSVEESGDKVKDLGDKTRGTKEKVEAVTGSIQFFKDEIQRLQKEIENTPAEPGAFEPLIKQLNEAESKLKEAERAFLLSKFEVKLGGEIAPPEFNVDEASRPEIEVIADLTVRESPDAESKAAAIKEALERNLGAIEFPIEPVLSPDALAAQEQAAQTLFDAQREQGKIEEENRQKRKDDAEAEKQKALEVKEALVNAGIDTAQAIADGVFQIQQQRLEQERDLAIENLDAEYKKKIDAAQGNAVKITALEKERETKRAAIEKAAAEERKKIALKEAGINIALAILKALTGSLPPFNFIAAGVVAAAGAIQLATINAQQFADSGVAKRVREQTKKRLGNVLSINKLPPGIIRERPNVAPTAKGDNVLALVKPGEMILNEQHQRAVREWAGDDIFGLVGVPGESMPRRSRNIPSFADGGVVGIVPQAGFRDTLNQQNAAIVVQTESRFTDEQIRQMAEIQAGILAQAVGGSVYAATTAAGDENNRLRERQQIAEQNRIG